jgi:sulfonate transport system substrate-binding protein
MMEAAIAHEIDVVLAGEQPVLTLLSKSGDWRVVARLTRYRSAIVIPVDSPLKSLSDLNGRTIATAFGSTTHRDLVRLLSEQGLDGKVKLVSLDQAEHAGVIERGGSQSWGELAGIGTYDPTIAAAVKQGKARILHAWASPALVAMHRNLVEERRSDAEAFLRAYVKAYAAYSANPRQANLWYGEESRLPLSDQEYAEIASFEPNLRARTAGDVDVRLTDEVLREVRRNIDVGFDLGILKSKPDMDKLVVRDLLGK